MFIAPHLPNIPFLTGRCQRFNTVGKHSLRDRVQGLMAQGLELKSVIRRCGWHGSAVPDADPLGAKSQFALGSWVRVRDESSIRKTLDDRSSLRGIRFSADQGITCSRAYRVAKIVRRILDDGRTPRPVDRTVLLEGADTDGSGNGEAQAGARRFPLLYLDEWLEPSDPAPPQPEEPGSFRHARIRPLEQILGQLDAFGRRDGLAFMPEMGRRTGSHARILRQLTRLRQHDRWVELKSPLYILEGMHCTGGILGSQGPCDCGCQLLWHVDWLELCLSNSKHVSLGLGTPDSGSPWGESARGSCKTARTPAAAGPQRGQTGRARG